jgi:hypothetical protein
VEEWLKRNFWRATALFFAWVALLLFGLLFVPPKAVMEANFVVDQADTLRRIATGVNGPEAIAHQLNFYLFYYSARTNYLQKSHVLHLIAAEHERTVKEAVAGLRRTSGEDLGDDAYLWLRTYGYTNFFGPLKEK